MLCVNQRRRRGRKEKSLTGTWVGVLTWQALWLETCREAYEAYVIYAFFKVRVQISKFQKLKKKYVIDTSNHMRLKANSECFRPMNSHVCYDQMRYRAKKSIGL
jgi:hypothetical protein